MRHIECLCDVRHIRVAHYRERRKRQLAVMEEGMWKVIAGLAVGVGVALVASSNFAPGGDSLPKKSRNASCVKLSNGESLCLTCQDGPCDIKSGPINPVTASAGSAIAHRSSAKSPKPKVSAADQQH